MIYYTAILIKQKAKDLFNKVKELWDKWKNRKMPKTEQMETKEEKEAREEEQNEDNKEDEVPVKQKKRSAETVMGMYKVPKGFNPIVEKGGVKISSRKVVKVPEQTQMMT